MTLSCHMRTWNYGFSQTQRAQLSSLYSRMFLLPPSGNVTTSVDPCQLGVKMHMSAHIDKVQTSRVTICNAL